MCFFYYLFLHYFCAPSFLFIAIVWMRTKKRTIFALHYFFLIRIVIVKFQHWQFKASRFMPIGKLFYTKYGHISTLYQRTILDHFRRFTVSSIVLLNKTTPIKFQQIPEQFLNQLNLLSP